MGRSGSLESADRRRHDRASESRIRSDKRPLRHPAKHNGRDRAGNQRRLLDRGGVRRPDLA